MAVLSTDYWDLASFNLPPLVTNELLDIMLLALALLDLWILDKFC
jgi:hypothetical protein